VAYAYLILDLSLAAMPFSISNLSLIHHIQIVGGLTPHELATSPASSVIWLAGMSLFWLALGLRRLSRSEFASGDR
jgi:hypothetical protein